MPEVSKHEPGTFCWIELATSDPKAGKSFYGGLFGWSVNEFPMGDQGIYYMFQKDKKDIAAMYKQGDNEKGVPPHWNNYVSVANADASAEKAKKLGAKVVAPPFDVMDAGRMAVIQDPQGAMFNLWQAGKNTGVKIINEPGTLTWNELYTNDIEGSRKFYSSLFGWKLKVSPEYTEVHVGTRGIGGMFQITKEMKGMPPCWMPYFLVTDVDGTAKKAQSSKGKITMPPKDIPNVGRIAMISDPQGAGFWIIKLK